MTMDNMITVTDMDFKDLEEKCFRRACAAAQAEMAGVLVFRRSAMKLPTHLSIPQSRLFASLKNLHKISAFTAHSFIK